MNTENYLFGFPLWSAELSRPHRKHSSSKQPQVRRSHQGKVFVSIRRRERPLQHAACIFPLSSILFLPCSFFSISIHLKPLLKCIIFTVTLGDKFYSDWLININNWLLSCNWRKVCFLNHSKPGFSFKQTI